VSAAILKILQDEGITADYVAGHSLGEYSALVAAQALSFEDAVWLVRQRGAFMQEAVPPGQGTMAAILGLDIEQVDALCRAASQYGVVEPANYNAPGQIVIAGATPAVEKAMEMAKEFGAKRAMGLSVSGPFHSSLLQPASLRLAEALEQVEVHDARIPVVANITADVATTAAEIKENLTKQVAGSVKWQQSVENMVAWGVTTFVEIGPGKVLTGLIKKIAKNVEMYNIEDVATLQQAVAALKGDGSNG